MKTYEGIVIRQTKTIGGRRMVLIFTREEGKLSAGTHISEKSKGSAALAIRPFAHGHYNMTEKKQDSRSVSSAEIIDAHYSLGEDPDRFVEASWALEFTDKVLQENKPEPELFGLLAEYLDMLSERKKDFRLLTIAYMIQVMKALGVFPEAADLTAGELISGVNGDILDVLLFLEGQPLSRLEKLRLDAATEKAVFGVIRRFAAEHLELGTMKSEVMMKSD